MTLETGPLDVLTREHRMIEDLLDRLTEIGGRIESGDPIPPTTVRVGVGLLDAYLHRVHARQFDVELWPEALAAAPPGCRVALHRVLNNHLRMRRSAQEVLARTARWAAGDPSARRAAARGLVELARSDRSATDYEEHGPFPCLGAVLSPRARERVGAQFGFHAGTKRVLEANIDRFLDATAAPRVVA